MKEVSKETHESRGGLFSSRKREFLLIAVVWLVVYAAVPFYSLYIQQSFGMQFQWEGVYHMWVLSTGFLVLFLVHHFLLAPCLVGSKRVWVYVMGVVLCMAVFYLFLVSCGPDFRGDHFPMHHHPHDHPHPGPRMHHKPWFALPEVAQSLVALLVLGIDLALMSYNNEQKMHRRLLLLEKQSIKQELDQLRYQINPHFFMNTLNNIHALVDIDQERAKRAIVELSGLMRYSLYEGAEDSAYKAPLQHEVEFLKQYVSLMQLRYSSRVSLKCSFPEQSPSEAMVPPLVLATFVENAFKHGISYKNPSYIDLRLEVDSSSRQVKFHCENSCHASASTCERGNGIGLANVKKRLGLQYADNYQLNINEEESRFVVDLMLPY